MVKGLLLCVIILAVVSDAAGPIDGLFLNMHITHHAGTSLFKLAKANGLHLDGVNGNFNLSPTTNIGSISQLSANDVLKKWRTPVTNDYHSWSNRNHVVSTPDEVQSVKPIRNYVSLEQELLDNVWDVLPLSDPSVHSMIAMRNPISRVLSGDGSMPKMIGHPPNYHTWMHIHTNYAIRYVAGIGKRTYNPSKYRLEGQHHLITEATYLKAVERLKKFDHILITEDMAETAQFICKEWQWNSCLPSRSNGTAQQVRHINPRLTINNDTLYREYMDLGYWDFKLYETAVQMARAQLIAGGYERSVIDTYPTDLRQAMLKGLETPLSELDRNPTRHLGVGSKSKLNDEKASSSTGNSYTSDWEEDVLIVYN